MYIMYWKTYTSKALQLGSLEQGNWFIATTWNIEMDNESFKRACKGAVSNNQVERDILYCNIMQVDQSFMDLHATDKFVNLFSSKSPQILTWRGRFYHKSLSAHNESQCGYPQTPLSTNTIDGVRKKISMWSLWHLWDEKMYFYFKECIFIMSSPEYIHIWRYYYS